MLSTESQFTEGDLELFRTTQLLHEWWRTILLVSACATAAMLLLTEFVMTQRYQAVAVLRPASQEGPNPIAGILGATGLMASGGSGSSLLSAFGLASAPTDALDQLAVLHSYNFNLSVANQHHLGRYLLRKTWWRDALKWLGSHPYSDWRLYEVLQKRLDAEYDSTAGNLTVSFVDSSPSRAREILGFYIAGLRRLLSRRSAEASTVAIGALRKQIKKTSDVVLINQLDALVAQQLQQKLSAQAEASFAFTVIQAPTVPDEPYAPWVFLDSLIIAIATPLLLYIGIVVTRRIWVPQRALLRLAEASADVGAERPAPDMDRGSHPRSEAVAPLAEAITHR